MRSSVLPEVNEVSLRSELQKSSAPLGAKADVGLPRTMQALVKPSAHRGMEMREVPVPSLGPNDVLIAVETASVCGTDLHIYEWDEWAQQRIKPPYIPGHEFCGTVAALGGSVHGFVVGDFVSAEMHVACGH